MEVTLLTKEQIWGDNALEVIKKYGQQTIASDLAATLGAQMDNIVANADGKLAALTWTSSDDGNCNVCCVLEDGREGSIDGSKQDDLPLAIRPVLQPKDTQNLAPKKTKKGPNGTTIVEWGEYPQTLADEKVSKQLEALYQAQTLTPTGKRYTFNSDGGYGNYGEYIHKVYDYEFELDGKKYVRAKGKMFDDMPHKFSNGTDVEERKPYWIEVKPIEWLKDPTGYWVAKDALLAGIPFNITGVGDYFGHNFDNAFLKKYLDRCFAEELEPSKIAKRDRTKSHTASSRRTPAPKAFRRISKLHRVLAKQAKGMTSVPERFKANTQKLSEACDRFIRDRKKKTM